MPGVIQRLRLQLDQQSVEQMKRDAFAAATGVADAIVAELKRSKSDEAGREIAVKAIEALKAQLLAKATELQDLVTKGMLSAAGAKKQGEAAGKDYAEGLLAELKKAQASGALTASQITTLKGTLAGSFGLDLKGLGADAPVAAEKVGLLSRALSFLREKLTDVPRPDLAGVGQGADDAALKVGEAARRAAESVAEAFRDPKVPQAAREQGVAAVTALEEAFRAKTQELQRLVAQGLLTPAEARRQGKLAGDEFVHGLQQTLKQGSVLAGVTAPLGLDLDGLKAKLRSTFEGGFLGVPKAVAGVKSLTAETGVLGRASGFLKSQVTSLLAPLAAFFTARSLLAFGKSSVREFEEDSRALNDLRVTVERAGASFTDLAPEIERVALAFQRSGRLSGSDFNRTLSQLIGISGDYENSLKNVSLVTDLAAAKHISLQQATDLVGKAMVGNARGLREFGIEVTKGDDAIVALNKAVGGFVQGQGPTLQKSLNSLSFLWRDFKSAVGEVITQAGGGTSAIDSLAGAIQGLTRFLKENKAEIAGFFQDFGSAGLRAVKDFIDNTKSEFGELKGVGDTITAFGQTLEAAIDRVLAKIEAAIAATLEFLGDSEGAAQVRTQAAAYRDEADALDALATANRESAKAARDNAAAARARLDLRASNARTEAQGITGGSSSTAGVEEVAIPTGGVATKKVHPLGGGTGAGDPDAALSRRIGLLTKATEVEGLRASALTALGKIETEIQATLARGNLPLERRIGLEEHLNAVQRARGTLPIEKLAAGEQLGILDKTVKLESLRAESLVHLGRLEEQFTAQMNDGTKSLEFRAAAEANLRQAQDLRGTRGFETLGLEQRIALLTQASTIEGMREAALTDLAAAEVELRAKMAQGTHTVEERIAANRQLAAIEATLGTRKIADLGLPEQIAAFRAGLETVSTFAESLRGLQAAEAKLKAEVDASIPGTQHRLQLEAELYQLRQTLGQTTLEDQIALLDKAVQSEETRAQAIRELIRLERELIELQRDPRAAGESRERVATAQTGVARALARAPQSEVRTARAAPDRRGNQTQAGAGVDAVEVPIVPTIDQKAIRDQTAAQIKSFGDELPPIVLPFKDDLIRTGIENIGIIATDVATNIVDVFEETFSRLADGSVSLGQSFLNLGKGLAHSILSEISKLARGKVIENIANAIEEKARAAAAAAVGNFPGAAAHTVAAASFLHAAASWGAVAVVSGIGAALTGGGGGGSSGGGNDRSAERKDPLENGKQPATIIIQGGLLDTDNVYQMDALAKAIGSVSDRDVVLQRGR